jgi:hypothetical protein
MSRWIRRNEVALGGLASRAWLACLLPPILDGGDVGYDHVYCAEHITNPSAAHPAWDIWLAVAWVIV